MTDKPNWIPCDSGSQPQVDACVRVAGGLVEILGHPQMRFTPEDAMILAAAIIHAAQQAGYIPPNEEFLPCPRP